MITFFYTCIHLPSGQRFARMARYDSLKEFYYQLCRWNKQQPDTWLYAATGCDTPSVAGISPLTYTR